MSRYLDLSTKPDRYYDQARPEMLAFVPEDAKKVLDVGCGEGLFGGRVKQRSGAEVWGIEVNSKVGAVAQTRIDRVIVGDISELISELPDAYFDCVIFNDVLEHLIDPFSVLAEARQKLTAAGVVVCSIPNVRYFSILRDLLLKKEWRYEDQGILDKTHLRFFTQKSIIDMFSSLGYEVLRVEGINAPRSWRFSLLNALSLWFLSDTRYPQFACVAKPK